VVVWEEANDSRPRRGDGNLRSGGQAG
jgi:hypothetical protein